MGEFKAIKGTGESINKVHSTHLQMSATLNCTLEKNAITRNDERSGEKAVFFLASFCAVGKFVHF